MMLKNIMFQRRGKQVPGARIPRQLNFVWWCLIFVGLQYGSCLIQLFFWQPEFWGGFWIFRKWVHIFQRLSQPLSSSKRGKKPKQLCPWYRANYNRLLPLFLPEDEGSQPDTMDKVNWSCSSSSSGGGSVKFQNGT